VTHSIFFENRMIRLYQTSSTGQPFLPRVMNVAKPARGGVMDFGDDGGNPAGAMR
jgi:hypothetical protein